MVIDRFVVLSFVLLRLSENPKVAGKTIKQYLEQM